MRCSLYRTMLALLSVMVFLWMPARGQLPGSIAVNRDAPYYSYTPEQLVKNVLITGCLSATNISFKGDFNADVRHRQLGYFNKGNSNFPLNEGLILSTGYIRNAEGYNLPPKSDQALGGTGDADLSSISGAATNDAAVLEFDFKPAGNTLEFKYIFASEEYLKWCCAPNNDAFGLFLSGPGITGTFTGGAANIALIPSTNTPVAINSVHPLVLLNYNFQHCEAQNEIYYIPNNNILDPTILSTQFNGMTVVMTATYQVVPCSTYHIKLSVGDGLSGDGNSAVFLQAHSFNSEANGAANTNVSVNLPDNSNIFEGCPAKQFILQRDPGNVSQPATVQILYGGTAANGVDIQTTGGQALPTTVTIPAGQATYTIDYIAVNDGPGDAGEALSIRILQSCPCDPNPVYITKTIKIWEQDVGLTLKANNIACGGAPSNGSITATATNGSGVNEFSLNGADWQSSNQFSGLTAGTYTVYVRDVGSCKSPVSAIVIIGTATELVANAGPDVTICRGSPVRLQGSGGSSYLWSPVDGLSDPEIANPIASPNVTTTYLLVVKDATGVCEGSDEVTVTVNEIPTVAISTVPSNSNVCVGNSSITLTASGGGTYLWNDPTHSINSSITVTPASSTSYTVIVTGANSCKADATANVVVHPLPTATLSGDATICSTLSATLNLSLTGTAPWNITYSDGVTSHTVVANNYSYSFPVSPTSTSTYTLVSATDYFGCAAATLTGSATVMVSDLPTPPTSVTIDNASFCQGAFSTITLTASGGSGTSINWYSGSCLSTIIGNGNTITIPAPAATTTYYASNVNSCGISACASTIVTIFQPPTPPTSVTTNSGKPTSYCLTNKPSTPYRLTANGAINATGYEWFKDVCGVGVLLATVSTYSLPAVPIATTTYYVRAINANCKSSCFSQIITVYPTSAGGIVTNNATVCSGNNSGTLNLSGQTGDVIKWQSSTDNFVSNVVDIANATTSLSYSNLAQTISYRAVVQSGTCASASSVAATITMAPALNAGAHNITSLTECLGYNPDNLIFTTPISGGKVPYTYQWQLNGAAIPGETLANYNPPALMVVGSYSYNCIVTDACGTSQATSPKVITIVPDPTVSISRAGAVCQNASLTLSATITDGTGSYNYKWESGPTASGAWTTIPLATSSTYSPSTSAVGTIYYHVIISPSFGSCNNAISPAVSVIINPLPTTSAIYHQ